MATILDKDLIRESTVKYDNREIQITLTQDQKISFKLKGMKSGVLSISIEELYKQLVGDEPSLEFDHESEEVEVTTTRSPLDKSTKDNPMISLHELRTKINTTPLGIDIIAKIDPIIAQCIRTAKKPFLDKEIEIKEAAKRKK